MKFNISLAQPLAVHRSFKGQIHKCQPHNRNIGDKLQPENGDEVARPTKCQTKANTDLTSFILFWMVDNLTISLVTTSIGRFDNNFEHILQSTIRTKIYNLKFY